MQLTCFINLLKAGKFFEVTENVQKLKFEKELGLQPCSYYFEIF